MSERVSFTTVMIGLGLGLYLMACRRAEQTASIEAYRASAREAINRKLQAWIEMDREKARRDLDFAGKHNKENLKVFLQDYNLETRCIYTRYYGMIQKLEEQDKATPQAMQQIGRDIKEDLKEKVKEILARQETDRDDFKKGLNLMHVSVWITHFIE